MASATKVEAITLRGPPHRLSAVVRLQTSSREILPITLKLPGGSAVFRARMAPFGRDTAEIRLRLPRETPPGTYGGLAVIGKENREVVVEVEPVVRTRVHPRQTTLATDPGSRAEFSVTVLNAGNVLLEIPRTAQFDLEDDDGQDRSLGRALRADLKKDETRMDRFFDEVREAHGGEARLTVVQGAGYVDPGQSCQLSAQLDVPVMVKAGRTYTGGWEIGDASHPIVIEATKGNGEPARRGRRKP
jgi:hypothetical protein